MTGRWSMEQDALNSLAKKTGSGTQDLGGLVKQLVNAAQPLEGKMSGAGKAMFDSFKQRVDAITADLNAGMGAIAEGQSGMDQSFRAGDQQMADTAKSNTSAANFDGAKFRKG